MSYGSGGSRRTPLLLSSASYIELELVRPLYSQQRWKPRIAVACGEPPGTKSWHYMRGRDCKATTKPRGSLRLGHASTSKSSSIRLRLVSTPYVTITKPRSASLRSAINLIVWLLLEVVFSHLQQFAIGLTCTSDSERLTFLKETARSQKRLVLRATNAHQTMSQWLLFAKNRESSQTNRL